MNLHDLYRQTRRAALGGIAVSLALGLAKLLGGLFGNSIALLSDAAHSLGDALTSGAVLGALYWAQQPADPEHPYGHSRVEAVAASNVALLLILAAIWIAWEALLSLGKEAAAPAGYTLMIAAASVVIKEGLYQYYRRVAGRTGSGSLRALAWDQRLDAFGSLTVVIGLAASFWGGRAWRSADDYAALAVAAFVFYAGGSLFWSSLNELMDRQADPRTLETVRLAAESVPGVQGVEKLFVRKSGLEFLVDMHVEVDATMSVQESHAIGHAVKDRVMAALITVRDVLVHIEPTPRTPVPQMEAGRANIP